MGVQENDAVWDKDGLVGKEGWKKFKIAPNKQ